MKLSILILTHKRPKLFKRCIESVLTNCDDYNIEIIVNNDSNDIEEIYNENIKIKYFYCKDTLKNIYLKLINLSKYEKVFFLEDDDYITSNFFKNVDLTYDLNFIEYEKDKKFIRKYINENSMKEYVNSCCKKQYKYYNDFIKNNNFIDFQLSQIIFDKKIIDYNLINKYIKDDNYIENDEILFLKCFKNCKINYIKDSCYIQTTDGNDNISL